MVFETVPMTLLLASQYLQTYDLLMIKLKQKTVFVHFSYVGLLISGLCLSQNPVLEF
jgi:hypothetical protein